MDIKTAIAFHTGPVVGGEDQCHLYNECLLSVGPHDDYRRNIYHRPSDDTYWKVTGLGERWSDEEQDASVHVVQVWKTETTSIIFLESGKAA